MSDADPYRNALRDIAFELRSMGRDPALSWDHRMGLYTALDLIKQQAANFGLDVDYIGLTDLDDSWLTPPYGQDS